MKTNCYFPAAFGHLRYSLVIALLIFSSRVGATCQVDFTYSHGSGILYHFTNTTTPLDTPNATIAWSVSGPGITYQSALVSPSFYFPVNGTYYVSLQISGTVTCGGYKIDTIVISGLSSAGTCAADMAYYPTYGSQFQFNDASMASDSIVAYSWYGRTVDTFFQVMGWDQNCVLALWAYNCRYPKYIVTHTITTISGCQASLTDTIRTYCGCQATYQPHIYLEYDSSLRHYYLTDSVAAPFQGFWYWQIGLADTTVFSRETNPPLLVTRDTLLTACVNLYDTVHHCLAVVCDSFNEVVTGLPSMRSPSGPLLNAFSPNGSQLHILYEGITPALGYLYDVDGRCLSHFAIRSQTTIEDISGFASGTYFLKVSSVTDRDIYCRFHQCAK